MTILDLVRLVRSNLRLLLLATVLGLVAAYLWTLTRPVVYTATSTGVVSAGNSSTVADAMAGSTLAASKVEAYSSLVNTRGVGERIVEDLGLSLDPSAVAGALTPSGNVSSGLMYISANASTPLEAQQLADAAMKATSEEALDLETRGVEGRSSAIELRPLQSALLPGAPSSPNLPLNLLVGAAIGLGVGFAMAFFRRRLDSRVRIASEVEQLTGTGVLGVIPDSSELGSRRSKKLDSRGPASEAIRHLRTNLRFVDVDNPPRSVIITSANQNEGKSTVASTLARMLAASGQPTILVDADLRRPNVATLLSLEDSVGLTQVLAGDVTLDEVLQESDQPGLVVLTAGRIPPNPSEMLGSRRMKELIEELERDYFVILDAPPLLPVTDAGLLSTQADGAVLVLYVGRTFKEQAALCRKILDQVGGNLLGTVLNRAPRKGMGTVVYGYGYGYGGYQQGYGYGYGGEGKRAGFLRRKKKGAERAPSKPVDLEPAEPQTRRSRRARA